MAGGSSQPPPVRPSAADIRRRSSTLHYTTFPNVRPPTGRGRPISGSRSSSYPEGPSDPASPEMANDNETPLPVKQLVMLAVIALAEQTAFNSIGPYLPEMTASFPEVKQGQEGLYVGLIASAFALAQFATNFFWGWLSDRIGRKPVIVCGTFLTMGCFLAFGFSRRLWHAVLIQVLLGLGNGNQGLVSTCLGEVTDRSNQSKAFTYLPVIYGIGAIAGPALGGLLVLENNPFKKGEPNPYPYALPNLVSAAILLIDAVLIMFFLEESLDNAKYFPPLGERVSTFFTWLWQFMSASNRPTYLRRLVNRNKSSHGTNADNQESSSPPALLPMLNDPSISKVSIFNRDTILLLASFLIFQLSNVAYGSLYPIFGEATPPVGRGLSPKDIGLSMAGAGIVTIVFQIFFYGKLREKLGNRISFRVSHALFIVAFLILPFVGYENKSGFGNGPVWVWFEIGLSLILKTVATVGGLTSALLMVI
jgi:predicted MFS family arabinose efflux permease